MSGVETVAWPTLKALLNAAPIDFAYVPVEGFYYIYTSGAVILVCTIARDGSADVIDFEGNFKDRAVDFFYGEANRYQNVTGNGTTVVKSGAGILRAVIVNNNTTAGVITLYDNTAGNGTKIATFQLGSPAGGLLSTSGLSGPLPIMALDVRFNTGLTLVRAGSLNNDITVLYR